MFDLWFETFVSYWTCILFLWNFDKYPIHLFTPHPNKPDSRSPLLSLINQIVVHGLFAFFFSDLNKTLPSASISDFVSVPLAIFSTSAVTYYVHRMMHTIPFMKRWHMEHHSWVQVKPIDTFDCHPMEHLLLNVGPLLVSMMYFQVSFIPFRILLHLAILSSVLAHFGSNGKHQLHHTNMNVNFGLGLQMFDRMHGTYLEQGKESNK